MSDCDELLTYHGGAKPGDTHTLATVRAVDDEILAYLKRRERRPKRAAEPVPDANRQAAPILGVRLSPVLPQGGD